MAEESDEQHKIFIEKAEDEYYVRVQHEMTKTHYISLIAAVSSERIQLVKRYPEEEAEAAYSDHEIRRKQEKIMDVFYQFGELMNLDPCDEKVQKAAEETAVLNLPGRSCGNSIKQDRNRCFSYIIFRKFLLISA